MHSCVCVCTMRSVHVQFVSQGAVFSPWPDGALTTGQMANTLPHFFPIPSFLPPSLPPSLSSSPASPQTPHHLSLSFPTSQHPLIPISHHTAAIINQSAVTVLCPIHFSLTFPNRRPLAPKLMLVRPAIISARGKTPCKCTCAYTLMLTWLLTFNGQTFSTRLAEIKSQK